MSPEEFTSLANRFSEAALLVTRDGIVLAANRQFHRFQISAPTLVGCRLADLTATAESEVNHYLRACARNRDPVVGVLSFKTQQGDDVAFRCDGALLHHDPERSNTQLMIKLVPRDESTTQFAVLNQKVADLNEEMHRRKQLQQDLLAQRESLRVTLASIGDGVIVSDTEGMVTFMNPIAETLTGWQQVDAVGQSVDTVFQIVDEVTRQPQENPASRALRKRAIVGLANHSVLISKDGVQRPIDDSAAPIQHNDGEILGVVLVFRDVSERRAAEIEQGRLAALVDSSEDAILGLTFSGIVTDWNAGAERLFGFSAEETVGQSILSSIVPETGKEEFFSTLGRVEQGERVEPFEAIRLRKNGRSVPVAIRISPILDSEMNVVGASAIDRDISKQKASELRRNARMAVTQVIADKKNTDQAIKEILAVLGDILGWDAVRFWSALPDQDFLQLRHAWCSHESNHAVALDETNRPTCERGQNLAGYVWHTGEPAWICDIAADDRFDRQHDDIPDTLHAALAYPIGSEDAFLGVIELYSGDVRSSDEDLIEMMGTVVSQLVQFLERDHAENQLRLSQRELVDSEERLRLALDAGRMGSWEWRIPSGKVIWSSTLEKIHGIAEGSFEGSFDAFQRDIYPADRERVLTRIQNTVQQGNLHHLEYRIVWPDGSVHWLESRGRVFRDDSGNPVRMIGICSDVTERKQLEQTLRFLAESSKSLSTLVDYKSTLQKIASLSVPNFADWCTVDMLEADGTVQRLAVAHVDPEKVAIADELHRRYPPRPDAEYGVMQVLRSGEAELMTEIPDALLQNVAVDDEHLQMLRELSLTSYMCVPLRVKESVLGVVTFVVAESGRRYSQTDLVMAADLAHRAAIAIQNALLYQQVREADRRKDEFLAMLAHELRNPLAPIRSGLDLLAMDSPSHREIVELMQDQVEHVVRLVDDLLDVSRIMRGKVELRKETTGLADLIKRSVHAVQSTIEHRHQKLTVQNATEPMYLNADPVRIVQVIENLLTNASKYMDPGGKIDLIVERDEDTAVVTVRDTGVGIEKELLPQVFDLFTQSSRSLDRSQGGLGIGLTLVQRLVEMHSGSVSAHSDGLGHGSTFVVRLPLVEATLRSSPTPRDVAKVAACRICVVDDNRSAAWLLKALLKKVGNHEVETAADGPTLLANINDFQPQVVFLDIGLPGMDGHQVAREIRQQPEFDDVLLVALTGYGQEEDRKNSRAAGFDLHLVKPPSVDQIKGVFSHPKLANTIAKKS
ncbi:multi-sensor hybrid histidine kinase [Rhodopirellula maiorica SM1]|uniref:histidine kinase n=1 Tax=Rhodopirellula maiorica SM1 TaxID=1265738 RepID=M5RPG4_9BACT|nr:PAS domain S-box protein [Rhodopirellula maiorica]EMI21228.1 multi-sensor hybrid histidine kinase [Rhodopirellula maiorica SM1]